MKVYFYSSKIMFLSIKEKCLKCKQIETTSLYSLFYLINTCAYMFGRVRTCIAHTLKTDFEYTFW